MTDNWSLRNRQSTPPFPLNGEWARPSHAPVAACRYNHPTSARSCKKVVLMNAWLHRARLGTQPKEVHHFPPFGMGEGVYRRREQGAKLTTLRFPGKVGKKWTLDTGHWAETPGAIF